MYVRFANKVSKRAKKYSPRLNSGWSFTRPKINFKKLPNYQNNIYFAVALIFCVAAHSDSLNKSLVTLLEKSLSEAFLLSFLLVDTLDRGPTRRITDFPIIRSSVKFLHKSLLREFSPLRESANVSFSTFTLVFVFNWFQKELFKDYQSFSH